MTSQSTYTKTGWDELERNSPVDRPASYEHPWPSNKGYDSRDYDPKLGCKHIAFCVDRIAPGESGMHHRHADAEEIHFLVSGTCQMMIDDEVIEVKELEAVRVPPEVRRSFYNHSDQDAVWLVMGAPMDEFLEEDLKSFREANGY
jgi:mannose-6-phosphate isomerase-like protein (cupin superfamily)